MTVYSICIGLHLLALSLWLGHMFVWSLITGPALKRIEPRETAEMLREASLFRGGLGWPALAVLVPTGLYMLHVRGITLEAMLSGAAFAGVQGTVLAVKLVLVGAMVVYQAVFGHRHAPIAIYFNMLAALVIIGASVVYVRGWIWI
jgi:uncharacterized membrane protein